MNRLRLPAAALRPAVVAMPGSKSISNRTLLLAALSEGTCVLEGLLQSDDTRRMLEALAVLGVRIDALDGETVRVHGCGGRFPNTGTELFLGNAGTAFRPLTAALALQEQGRHRLYGVARMHERPIGDLVDTLRGCGADIRYEAAEGYPPLLIGTRAQADIKQPLRVRGSVSSQFLTALLMALPLTGRAAEIEVEGELISKPYIDITCRLMAQFGVQAACSDYRSFRVPAARYRAPERLRIEGDASGASYFLAAGVLAGVPVRVTGIGRNSIQGDTAFAAELEKIGGCIVWGEDFIETGRQAGQCIRAFDIDANHIPDAAMTLAVVALAADGPCTLRNIASWRVKETDRIAAMAAELRKLGAQVEEQPDSIRITPPPHLAADAAIDTYDDHRMAMCFSLVSLLGVPVVINDPDCVNKTFPDYFRRFAACTVPAA